MPASPAPSRWIAARAWFVHFYTSLGLVCALAALMALVRKDLLGMLIALAIAMFVDGTDGPMARAFDVKKNTPHFDGRKLDDIIDYITYTFIPIFFLYHFEIVTGIWVYALFPALIASAYGFCNDSAKTDDGFFTGFPSYWNGLALYLFWLKAPAWLAGALLLVFAALVFVPIKYPSLNQTRQFQWLTYLLTAAWFVLVMWMIFTDAANPNPTLAWVTLFLPVYYMGMAVYLTLKGQQ